MSQKEKTDRHTAIPDYEVWVCGDCLRPFLIPPSYAPTLFEYGCARCGSHEFSLYDLTKELEVY